MSELKMCVVLQYLFIVLTIVFAITGNTPAVNVFAVMSTVFAAAALIIHRIDNPKATNQ